MHKALEGTAALLQDEVEAKEEAVSALEKKMLSYRRCTFYPEFKNVY